MPTVINRHHYRNPKSTKADRRPPLPRPWVYIGRGTPLGNPFVAVEGEPPGEALRRYRRWLFDRLQDRQSEQAKALRRITDEHHLVCSCKPRPCHGDIVVKARAWLLEEEAPDRSADLHERLGALAHAKLARHLSRDPDQRERELADEDERRLAEIRRQVEHEIERRRQEGSP